MSVRAADQELSDRQSLAQTVNRHRSSVDAFAADPPAGNFKDLNNEALNAIIGTVPYRDAVCTLCEKTVALALDIPVGRLHARTRCSAEVALGRQIAMYLSHTVFSLLLTEIGLHFSRDRTTVSHACAIVEDRRDEFEFDVLLSQLESLLAEARNAILLSLGEGLPRAYLSAESEAHLDESAEPAPFAPLRRRQA